MFISVIPQSHCRIIERFGKPICVQKSGLAFKIPFLDKHKIVGEIWGEKANKKGIFIELSEQIDDTKPRECFTKDNVKVLIDSVIRWRIIDPIKAVYEVDKLFDSLLNATLNAMRSEIGSMELDNVLSARQSLAEKIVSNLVTTTLRWGIQIIAVEIQELKTDDAAAEAMLQQMEAERRSRAIASQAEGEAKAIIKRAEAEKSASILKAEGISKSLEVIAIAEKNYLEVLSQSVGKESAARILLTQKTIEGFAIISSKEGDKVYIPSNVGGFINFGDSIK